MFARLKIRMNLWIYVIRRIANTITTAIQSNFLFEKPKMIASDTRKSADVMKLYFIDLKKEIIASINAKAKTQLFCLKIKDGIFQKKIISG